MKLVRDKIPDMLMKQGRSIQLRTANDAEYGSMLIRKLREEVDEFIDQRNVEELADIEEVLRACAEHMKVDWEKVEEARSRKETSRGGFKRRMILDGVTEK